MKKTTTTTKSDVRHANEVLLCEEIKKPKKTKDN
jgi:hypothetical protein